MDADIRSDPLKNGLSLGSGSDPNFHRVGEPNILLFKSQPQQHATWAGRFL